jgi:hypothetical protein
LADGDSMTPVPEAAAADTRGAALVCGLDLSGFSAWTQAHIADDGAAAVEAIADTLDAFFLRCEASLRREGHHLRAFLGDGLLTSGPPAADVDAYRRLTEALRRAEPPGPLRMAAADGELWSARVGGWSGRWFDLVSGPVIADCHARLRELSVASPPELIRDWAPPHTAYAAGKLSEAELADQTFLIARLDPSDPAAAWRIFRWALPRIQAAADAAEGVVEAAAHDDAGLMLRIAFPHSAAGDTAASDLARWVLALFRDAGAAAGVGLAAGRVFRGVANWDSGPLVVVQGAPVNRAAKLAKSAFGLSRDPSLPERPPTPYRRGAASGAVVIGALDGLGGYEDLHRAIAPDRDAAEVHIDAAAGLGKSHLLRTLAREPRTHEAILVAAEPRHAADPLWLASRLVEAVAARRPEAAAAIARALPEEEAALARRRNPAQRGGREADISLASSLALRALAALPAGRPQLILLDDLQWADRATVALLRRALDAGAALQLVTTRRLRSGADAHPLGEAVRLMPLRPDEMYRALEAAGAPLDAAAAAEVHRLSGGAPLFGVQLALLAKEAGELAAADLREVLDRRLSRLAPPERATLRVLALADRPLEADRIARATGLAEGPARQVLAGLVSRRLVDAEPGGATGFASVHRAVSDRVAAALPPSVRQALHGRLARVLAGASAGGGEIGAHYLAGGEAVRGALRHLRDGEAALQAGAYAAALDLLKRGADALPDGSGAAVRTAYARAGRALAAWGLGRVTEAHDHARSALDSLDGAIGGALRRRAAILFDRGRRLPRRGRAALLRASVARTETSLFRGDLAEMAAANLACARIAGEGPVQAAARARGLSTLGLLFGLARAAPLAEAVYHRARSLAEGPDQAYVIASQAVWRLAFGRWRAARIELDHAGRLLGTAANPHLREALLTLGALCAQMEGRLEDAEADFRQLESAARLRGNVLHVAWGLYGRAMPLLHAGGAQEAADLADAAYTILSDAGDLQSELNALGLAAQARHRLGEQRTALDRAAAAVAIARRTSPLNFGTLEGYAGPAAASAGVAVDPATPPALRGEARALAGAATHELVRFARVFPIGRPRLLAVRSLLAGEADAPRFVRAAEAEARALGMACERWDAGWFDPRLRG